MCIFLLSRAGRKKNEIVTIGVIQNKGAGIKTSIAQKIFQYLTRKWELLDQLRIDQH